MPLKSTVLALDQHLQAEIVRWKSVFQKTGEYAD